MEEIITIVASATIRVTEAEDNTQRLVSTSIAVDADAIDVQLQFIDVAKQTYTPIGLESMVRLFATGLATALRYAAENKVCSPQDLAREFQEEYDKASARGGKLESKISSFIGKPTNN